MWAYFFHTTKSLEVLIQVNLVSQESYQKSKFFLYHYYP